MIGLEPTPVDPYPAAEWALWYWDLFDRDAPARIELTGRGLVTGLAELWARHFLETVTADGRQGFATFRLQWQQGSITISGEWAGARRLRHWLFGAKESAEHGYVAAADASLLAAVAYGHARLVQREQSAEQILALAAIARDRRDFEERLSILVEG